MAYLPEGIKMTETIQIKYEILRWIAMPFAAFLGATVGCFLIVGFQWLILRFFHGFSENGGCFIYILPLVASAIYGWLFVVSAAKVAPRGKFTACVVMVTVQGVLFLMAGIVYCVSSDDPTGSKIWESLRLAVAVGSSIVSLTDSKEFGWA